MERNELVVGVLQAADGEIVGKIRTQKVFYLLEQLGLGAGLPFSYHHYGPYSEDLANSLMYSELIDGSVTEENRTTNKGFTFSAYVLSVDLGINPDFVGNLSFDQVANFVKVMKSETSIVIELAATIHWLRFKEKIEDWHLELKRRKASKAEPRFVERAELLLSKLELAG